jgi:nucleotide-binding universal stress UspA family protein
MTRTHRIVVGIDGSSTSGTTLEWAAWRAELTGSSLEVLSIWDCPAAYGATPISSDFDPRAEAANEVDGVVKGVRGDFPEIVVQTHVVQGHSALTLEEPSHEVDLPVVGSRGSGEFEGMRLGSVSQYRALPDGDRPTVTDLFLLVGMSRADLRLGR